MDLYHLIVQHKNCLLSSHLKLIKLKIQRIQMLVQASFVHFVEINSLKKVINSVENVDKEDDL